MTGYLAAWLLLAMSLRGSRIASHRPQAIRGFPYRTGLQWCFLFSVCQAVRMSGDAHTMRRSGGPRHA
jgi:hypothetical protein